MRETVKEVRESDGKNVAKQCRGMIRAYRSVTEMAWRHSWGVVALEIMFL